jgi:NAD(P)-dependent dehydrogenase (short-subunit alcohol dehydrogenase family)
MPSLKNRVIVITGGSAGIGRATALAFAREGAHVVIAARRREKLDEVCREVEALGARCLAVVTDVAQQEQVEHLLEATLETFGQVDVWVNNAGYGISAPVALTTPEAMERIWRVNYMGAFYGTQAALRQMRRQGRGHIMNVSSMAARFPLPLGGAYTATKYAMNGLTETLALELEGSGIHASVIMPGVTETEFVQAMEKKIPDVEAGWTGPIASAESVAKRIVACAKRPRKMVYVLPFGRLALSVCDLFPGIWRVVARKYIKIRTGGAGVPHASE